MNQSSVFSLEVKIILLLLHQNVSVFAHSGNDLGPSDRASTVNSHALTPHFGGRQLRKGGGSKGPNGDRAPIRSMDSWVLRPKP